MMFGNFTVETNLDYRKRGKKYPQGCGQGRHRHLSLLAGSTPEKAAAGILHLAVSLIN